MKTWPGILIASLLAACGARSGLPEPSVDLVAPGPLPAYCQDAGDTPIYVVTYDYRLFRFDPPSAAFTQVGTLDCPVDITATSPSVMAVDHHGTAYVVNDDGEMVTASTATASCSQTSAPVNPPGFTSTWGMAFSTDSGGLGETLYLAGTTSPGQLGTLDTSTFVIQTVGAFSSDIVFAELTGDGAGQLFGFGGPAGSVNHLASANHLVAIDKGDASILDEILVPTPQWPVPWAFALWGGDFYFFSFTSLDAGTSTVGRYRPADGSFEASYATLDSGTITAAGVSTCAPR